MEDITYAEPAILVRGVSKQYGNEQKVLDNLDMTVIKGTIYGLLGASGCGKTTLLSAILGSRNIQNGAISILGKPPGVVPVKSIGYMPQDVALIGEMSIRNVIQQQGWIFGMTTKEIEERHKFCEDLLDLPPANRLIKNLSGGQQRRVSLAVVLIHDPELLVLDEPTVGLDPVLRQNLWDYLIKITKEDKKTVVITTHYIEEAKQANRVGMLRNGKMIAEEDPQALMNRLNFSSLEDLFVSLSTQQEARDSNTNDLFHQSLVISKTDEFKILNQMVPKKSRLKETFSLNAGHTKALLSKNFIRYVRNPITLLITVLIPIIQITSAFTAIGHIPDDLKIGIVNEELGDYRNCEEYSKNNTVGGYVIDEFKTCQFEGLACKFTDDFRAVIKNQVYFSSMEEAQKAIKAKKIEQLLFFPHNYSEAYTEVVNFNGLVLENFNHSRFSFYRADINDPLGTYMEKELHNVYFKFAEELAEDCQWNKNSVKYPVHFKEPIYGKPNFTYSDLIAPGVMTIAVAFLPKALAITTVISERNDGVWERTMISGVKPIEMLISHIITLSFTAVIQVLECFLTAYYVFGFECKGSVLLALLLLYLLALLGVTMGTALCLTFKDERTAMFGALGIAFPMFIISGAVWPIESQPTYLKYFSYAVPSTIPLESLNNIIFKGWDITNFNVYKGYIFVFGYICFCTIISLLGLKFDNK